MQILFFFSAFIAEIIGTTVGFGSSTVFLPLALFFVDFKTALVLVALFHIFGNLSRLTFFRKAIDKNLILLFGVTSVIFSITGAFLVNYTPQNILKLILGIFLLIFAIVSLYKPDFKFPASKKSALTGGALSGFLAGLIGTGGALRGAFLTAFNLEKTKYIATTAVVGVAVDLTRIPVYFSGGFLSSRFYYYIPILLLIAIIGSYTGKKIVNFLPQKIFQKIVLIALALIGLKFISDGVAF